MWKWARNLNSHLKAHTQAHVSYSYGYWLLIPVFIIPYILTVAEWFRARDIEEMPVLRIGDVYVPSVAPSPHTGGTGAGSKRSRSERDDSGERGGGINWIGAEETPRAPDRHRPIYTWFPEPEGEFVTSRAGNTPPPSGFWGRAYEGSSTTAYPSSGSTVYPPSHWGQY